MKKIQKKRVKKIRLLGYEISVAFVIFLALLVVSTVLMAIESSAQGARLVAIEKERMALEEKNIELTRKLVNRTSLTRVEEFARQEGMVKPEKTVYLTREAPVAALQQ